MSQLQPTESVAVGKLAQDFGGRNLPLQVLKSQAGFYIGTSIEGFPFTRESKEYFRKTEDAASALATGGWTQKANV